MTVDTSPHRPTLDPCAPPNYWTGKSPGPNRCRLPNWRAPSDCGICGSPTGSPAGSKPSARSFKLSRTGPRHAWTHSYPGWTICFPNATASRPRANSTPPSWHPSGTLLFCKVTPHRSLAPTPEKPLTLQEDNKNPRQGRRSSPKKATTLLSQQHNPLSRPSSRQAPPNGRDPITGYSGISLPASTNALLARALKNTSTLLHN